MIKLKRAYDKPNAGDGYRILVDRLWPRGVSKQSARLDLWLKDVAPSPALRTWFGHDPARWQVFSRKYSAELKECPEGIARLRDLVAEGPVTFVYGAKDSEHTHALVLKAFVEGRKAAMKKSALRKRASKNIGRR